MVRDAKTTKRLRIISTVLLFVIVVLTPVALYTNWSTTTVADKERFVEAFAPLASNSEVQKSLSLSAENLIQSADIEGVIEEYLPPALAPVSGLLASGVESSMKNLVDRFIYSDQFSVVWTRLTETLHAELIGVLEGDTDRFVRAGDDGLYVTVEPLREAVLERISDIPVVKLASSRIEAAELPRLQLLNEEQLSFITFVWNTNKFIGFFIWPAIFFAGIASVLLRGSLWRGGIYVGASVVAGGIVTLTSVAVTKSRIETELAAGIFGRAISEIFAQLTLTLQYSSYWTIAVGAVIVAAFAAGGYLTQFRPDLVEGMFDSAKKVLPAASEKVKSFAGGEPAEAPAAPQPAAKKTGASKKPPAKKPATKKPAPKKTSSSPAAKTAASPAVKKPTAKKPAAKKPAAKKPAAKKPAPKKPGAGS